MKKFGFYVLSILLLSSAAQALECSQHIPPNVRLSKLYSLSLSQDEKSVELIVTESGKREVVEVLPCVPYVDTSEPGNGGINPTYLDLTCQSLQVQEGERTVSFYYSPVINTRSARLFEATPSGTPSYLGFSCAK